MRNQLLNLLPIGSDNPISRAQLQKFLNIPDRKIRDEIREIRLKNIPVVSSSSKAGYYIADNQEEIEAFIRENKSRIRELEAVNAIMMQCEAIPDINALYEVLEAKT